MRYIILFFAFLLVTINLSSQGSEQNTVTTIDEAQKKFRGRRNLTYEYLLNKDFKKISDFLESPLVLELPSGYNERLQTFYQEEAVLILFRLGEYNEILNAVINNSYAKGSINETGKEQQAIIPYKDSFYEDILNLSHKNQDELKEKLKASSLQQKDIDFLLLYLDFRLTETNLETFDKGSLISSAKNYKDNYQNSKYTEFIDSNIDINYKTSDFGLGSTLFIGGNFFSDNLGNNISGGMPIGGIINVAYKKVLFDFHFTGSLSSRVKQDFTYEELWEKNTRTTLALGSVSLGYAVVSNQKLMVTPSFGLASTNLSSYIRNEERGEVNVKIDNIPVLHTSITFDYLIKRKMVFTEYRDRLIAEFDKTYWVIRLKTGLVTPNFEDENNVFKGNVFYIGAGIGIFTYPAQLKKK